MLKSKKRLISWLVTISMLISLVAGFTIAVTANSGATAISTAEQFMDLVGDNQYGNFILTADLDFSEITNEAPLFSYEAPFKGTLDGDGYTIKNYQYASTENYVGLFRFNGGTIQNLIMDESCSISGNAYVGAIAGQNNGKIYDCISRAAVTCQKPVDSPTVYKVMTQNLWSGGEQHYLETYKPATYDSTNGSPRFSKMLERINSKSPDILALQEVTGQGQSVTYTPDGGSEQTVTTANWNTYLWGDGNVTGKLAGNYTLLEYDTHNDGANNHEAVQLAYKTANFSVASKDVEGVATPYAGLVTLKSGRKAVFAVLQSIADPNDLLLVYAYHGTASSTANDTADLKTSIESVYAELMLDDNLKSKRILAVAAGTGYGVGSLESAFDGHMDDGRTVAEGVTNDAGTVYTGSGDEDVSTLTIDSTAASCITIRDNILVNSNTVEINKIDVLYTGYTVEGGNYIHPSNHAAVYAEIEALSGSQIGGIIGRNSGYVERVICDNEFNVTNAEQVGQAIGVHRGGGNTVAVFSENSTKTIGGRSAKISGVESLTPRPSLEVIWKLTEASETDEKARFRVIDEEYRILRASELKDNAAAYEGEYRIPARIGVNGVYYYDYVGGTFNLDVTGIPEPKYLVKDGVIVELDSTEFDVTGDMNVAVATSIANVALASQLGVKYYTIGSADELVLAQKNLDKFNSLAVTIYLTADIDLSGRSDFDGFRENVYFSFDGQGHTISNWSHNNAVGFFSGASGSNATTSVGYRGYYIKNVTFDNLNLKDGYGRSIVVGMAAGENDFLMENVHVKSSTTTSTGGGNLAGIFYTHSNHDVQKTVTIRNCSAVNCTITTTVGDFTNSGVIGGRLGNGITWDISDIYIRNFNNQSNSKTDTSNGNGFLIGTIEGSTVTLNNIGIFDSKHIHRTDDSIQPMGYELIGRFISGTCNAKNIICVGNTANAFYASAGYKELNVTREGSIYTDNALAYQNLYSLTSGEAAPVIDGQSDYETMSGFGAKIDGVDCTVSMAAYGVNTGLTEDNIHWKVDDSGNIATCSAEEQTRKVTINTLVDENDDGIAESVKPEIFYLNGGAEIYVEFDEGYYPYVNPESGASIDTSVSPEKLTVGTKADTVVSAIGKDTDAYMVVEQLNYFSLRNTAYYADYDVETTGLNALLAKAHKNLADGTYITDSAAATEMAEELEAYKANFYSGEFNAERIPEASAENIALYQNQPEGGDPQGSPIGYIIMNTEQLLDVKANEGVFTTKQTIYLGADLDLTGVDFVGFGATNLVAGSVAVEFNFDGLNHTLSNWGKGENLTKLSAGKFGGLFRYADTSVIKNLTIKDAVLTSTLERTSLLFSSSTNGADDTIKLNDSREAQLIENVHIIGCELTSTYESSLFMSNLQPYRASVTFENCSVKDSSINGTGNNHATFVGRTSAGGGSSKTLTLRNCYVDTVSIAAAADANGNAANSGILVGSFEDGCHAAVQNVGVFNSSVKSNGVHSDKKHGAAILGVQTNGSLTIDNVVTDNNTVSVTTEGIESKCYLLAGNLNVTAATHIYYGDTYGIDPNSSISVTSIADDQIASGEVAYLLNSGHQNGYQYWENQDSLPAFCNLANATRQLTVKNNLGATMDTFYLGGGESVTLDYPENSDERYTIAPSGGATQAVVGGKTVVTMGTTSDMAVTATATTDAFEAYGYPSVTNITESNTAANQTTELDYTINSLEEWMYVYNHQACFRGNENITLHLMCDIDLTGNTTFTGFADLQGTFNGHNYTIKNWGTKNSPISSYGMWYATRPTAAASKQTIDGKEYDRFTADGEGMNALMNFKVENCHVTAKDTEAVIVYNPNHWNLGNDLPEEFIMSGVHVSDSSLKAVAEANGILLSRYGAIGKNATVTIEDCSVVGCTINASGQAHTGLVLGKARKSEPVIGAEDDSNTAPNATTTTYYNISDIYLYDNKITNTKDSTGLIFGCSEYATVNVKNAGVIGNSTANSLSVADSEVGLAGSYNSGGDRPSLKNCFFGGNTLSAKSTYLLAGSNTYSNPGRDLSGVYYDNVNLTEVCDDANNSVVNTTVPAGITQKTEDSFISGEIAYLTNTAIDGTTPSFYWMMNGGAAEPAYDKADATRKLIMKKDATIVKNRYLNGGAMIALSVSEDPDATFTLTGGNNGNATIAADQITLTMATEGTWAVTVEINSDEDFGAYGSNSVLKVTDTRCSDGAKYDFTIANATEWMYVFNHSGPRADHITNGVLNQPNYFSYPNVTLHLIGDIDLSEEVAEEFTGFVNVRFSLDGHGYTIKNWGVDDPMTSRGIFAIIDAQNHYASNTAHPHYLGKAMNSLKNFNVENAHVKNNEKGCAIVCGFFAGGSVCSAELPATFTMENIHVRNSSMSGVNDDADREQAVLLATYYRPAAADETTVKIVGCSVEDVTLDCGSSHAENSGALVGKMFANRTDKRHIFVLADNYIDGFTLTNASIKSGLLFGVLEYGFSSDANVKLAADTHYVDLHAYNNGIFNSSITTAANDAALLGICNDESLAAGGHYGSYYYFRSNLMEGNTLTNNQNNSTAGRYLLGSSNSKAGGGSFNNTNIVDNPLLAVSYDATEQNGAVKGWGGSKEKYIAFAPSSDSDYLKDTDADLYLNPSDENRVATQSYHRKDFAHGYAAYTNNINGTSGYEYSIGRTRYWTVNPANGDTIPTENGNRTRKVTFTLKDGAADPIAADEQIGYGYTGSDKLVLADGIDDYTFSLYEWEKASTGAAYDRTTQITASDTDANQVASVWAYAVFSDSLESAMEYWANKDIARYFADAVTIQKHIDLMKERIAENYYQLQENAVAGLGFAALTKDTNLIKAYYANYQEANEDASNVPRASYYEEYNDAPHFRIDNFTDLLAVDDGSNAGHYEVGDTIYLRTDLDFESAAYREVYEEGVRDFNGLNSANFNFIGIQKNGENPLISNLSSTEPQNLPAGFLTRPAGNIFKNFDFEDVHFTGGTGTGLFAGSTQDNCGGSGVISFENIHINNCSITSHQSGGYEQTAYLLPNLQAGRSGVDISDCSFTNCTTTGQNNNNSVLIGRLVHSDQTLNVKNVLVENVDISSKGRSNTLLMGVLEGNLVLNVENVGIFNSSVKSLGTGGYNEAGNSSALTYILTAVRNPCTVRIKNVLMADNTQYTAAESTGYKNCVIAVDTADGSTVALENCYIDSDYKEQGTHYTEASSLSHTNISDGDAATGEILYQADANGDGEQEVLTDVAFKNGKAAWIANQNQLKAGDADGETWLVDASFDAYPTLFMESGLAVPNQVLLTNKTGEDAVLDDYYTNSQDLLPEQAKTFMTTYNTIHDGGTALDWHDVENPSAIYRATDSFIDAKIGGDNTVTLDVQGVICVEVSWGEMEFTFDFGTWDPHNYVYVGRTWGLKEGTDSNITLYNNSNVYTEVKLTYTESDPATYTGVDGQFYEGDTPQTAQTVIPMVAKSGDYTRSFRFTGVPEWDTKEITIGTITVVVNQ